MHFKTVRALSFPAYSIQNHCPKRERAEKLDFKRKSIEIGVVQPMPRKKKAPYKIYKGHFSLPAALLALDDFKRLSCRATKLLIDLGAQYTGYNNGDLSITRSMMVDRGWTSNDQLMKAKTELLDRNLIIETKVGGLRMGPSLYAFTWQPIQECGGKLDVGPTTTAPRSLSEK